MIKQKTLILNKIKKQGIPLKLFLYAIREDDTFENFIKTTEINQQDFLEFKNLTIRFGLLPQIYLKLTRDNLPKNLSKHLLADLIVALQKFYQMVSRSQY